MSTRKITKYITKITSDNNSPWVLALADAEREMDQAKHRVVQLKATIAVIREKLETNAPFPGEKELKKAGLLQ